MTQDTHLDLETQDVFDLGAASERTEGFGNQPGEVGDRLEIA